MVSLGEELKREREYREITLREISDATKINIRMLEAIENDNYNLLPGGIFNRNFIRAYAEFIGLDPEIAVRKYLVQAVSVQPSDEKLPPFAGSITGTKSPSVAKMGRGWSYLIVVILAVVLVTLLVWIYREALPWPGSVGSMLSHPFKDTYESNC